MAPVRIQATAQLCVPASPRRGAGLGRSRPRPGRGVRRREPGRDHVRLLPEGAAIDTPVLASAYTAERDVGPMIVRAVLRLILSRAEASAGHMQAWSLRGLTAVAGVDVDASVRRRGRSKVASGLRPIVNPVVHGRSPEIASAWLASYACNTSTKAGLPDRERPLSPLRRRDGSKSRRRKAKGPGRDTPPVAKTAGARHGAGSTPEERPTWPRPALPHPAAPCCSASP